MKIVGLMPVRNEQWCLGLSVRAALMWCDELVILDHASTDQSREIMDSLSVESKGRVWRIWNNDSQWNEMAHRQELLDAARMIGATHIALIDADECLSGNLLPHIREHVERTPAGSILQMPWLCLRDSTDQVMISGLWGQATVSAAFKDDPAFHWAARNGYDFHQRNPLGRAFAAHAPHWLPSETVPFLPTERTRNAGLMHLQFCSKRRLLAKQALYQCIEVLRWPGRKPVHQVREMYAKTVTEAASAIVRPVPATWWAPYVDLMRYLDVDAEPWQEAEVRRLVAEHGQARFNGLDLFGVA